MTNNMPKEYNEFCNTLMNIMFSDDLDMRSNKYRGGIMYLFDHWNGSAPLVIFTDPKDERESYIEANDRIIINGADFPDVMKFAVEKCKNYFQIKKQFELLSKIKKATRCLEEVIHKQKQY